MLEGCFTLESKVIPNLISSPLHTHSFENKLWEIFKFISQP